MLALIGDSIMDLRYFWLRELELDGIPLVVSRTGWSGEFGYELYLRHGSRGDELWEKVMAAGATFGLKPGHTSTIRRIEGACCLTTPTWTSTRTPSSWGLTGS
jgi:glycine cleavage system aminomethyltransferase T